jgi:hypothetical protein
VGDCPASTDVTCRLEGARPLHRPPTRNIRSLVVKPTRSCQPETATLGCRLASFVIRPFSRGGLAMSSFWGGKRPSVSFYYRQCAASTGRQPSGALACGCRTECLSASQSYPSLRLTTEARRPVRATKTQVAVCDVENWERSGAPRNVAV